MTIAPTTRLHYDDSLLLDFDARVVAHASFAGKPSLVLAATAFYAEAGGQMGDRGTIGGLEIVDVQVDGAGVVHHVVSSNASLDAAQIGAELRASIDRRRRRAHMALHTGQHMLSRALADVAKAETVSSRLGESACTIDVDKEVLDERAVAEAEALVNSVIDDDVKVRAYFPDPKELATLPLRRAPKVTENVRVVMVGDFDCSPCGGTHCLSSAQVGFVRVFGVERYKGKARVTFAAGPRARDAVFGESAALRDLGKELTCGPLDVVNAIDKVRREMLGAKEALGRARVRLAESIAAELVAEASARGDDRVIGVVEDATQELLRALASRITARAPKSVAMLAGATNDGTLSMIARGPESSFDCGAFLKKAAQLAGGRGGGRPEHAEGRLPRDVDWKAIVAKALER